MTRLRYIVGNLIAVGLWSASVVLVTLIFAQPTLLIIYGFIAGYVLGRWWFPYWRRVYVASNRPPVVWSAAEITIYNDGLRKRDVQ